MLNVNILRVSEVECDLECCCDGELHVTYTLGFTEYESQLNVSAGDVFSLAGRLVYAAVIQEGYHRITQSGYYHVTYSNIDNDRVERTTRMELRNGERLPQFDNVNLRLSSVEWVEAIADERIRTTLSAATSSVPVVAAQRLVRDLMRRTVRNVELRDRRLVGVGEDIDIHYYEGQPRFNQRTNRILPLSNDALMDMLSRPSQTTARSTLRAAHVPPEQIIPNSDPRSTRRTTRGVRADSIAFDEWAVIS